MHIRNMLNDDGPQETVASPAGDGDWFGDSGGSATTLDDVDAIVGDASARHDAAKEIERPSSVPYASSERFLTERRLSHGLPGHHRPPVISHPSFPTSLPQDRPRLPFLHNNAPAQHWQSPSPMSSYANYGPPSYGQPLPPSANNANPGFSFSPLPPSSQQPAPHLSRFHPQP